MCCCTSAAGAPSLWSSQQRGAALLEESWSGVSSAMSAAGLVPATKRGRNSAKCSKAACLACLNRMALSYPNCRCATSRSSPALLVTRCWESPKKSAETKDASVSSSSPKADYRVAEQVLHLRDPTAVHRTARSSCVIGGELLQPRGHQRLLIVRADIEAFDSSLAASTEFFG